MIGGITVASTTPAAVPCISSDPRNMSQAIRAGATTTGTTTTTMGMTAVGTMMTTITTVTTDWRQDSEVPNTAPIP